MKSHILSGRAVGFVRLCIREAKDDRISIYAAQASFFVITSAIPFLSLLFSLTGLLLPRSDLIGQLIAGLPDSAAELIGTPSVPLLSISAAAALWTSSRGISAVRAGIENVYRADVPEGFIRRRVRSVVSTLFFILIIVSYAAVMLFGNHLAGFLPERIAGMLKSLGTPFFIVVMTVLFTSVYLSVAQRSTSVSRNLSAHLPGAVLSSSGWVIFSLLYTFYIDNFPRASAVYGGLAAVCLIMLWLYFCMVILLFGAVFNRIRQRQKSKRRS